MARADSDSRQRHVQRLSAAVSVRTGAVEPPPDGRHLPHVERRVARGQAQKLMAAAKQLLASVLSRALFYAVADAAVGRAATDPRAARVLRFATVARSVSRTLAPTFKYKAGIMG
ncbi:hypothetical protein FOA52_007169 [Chlamydomonas sp. UWO 241]|nr:hypothetical protein FOA52_007169 [Chlamydomonas sp. UWO 241]